MCFLRSQRPRERGRSGAFAFTPNGRTSAESTRKGERRESVAFALTLRASEDDSHRITACASPRAPGAVNVS
jgi:hypothetical protein